MNSLAKYTTDSLPVCLEKRRQSDSLQCFVVYTYKGEQWFVTTDGLQKNKQTPAKVYTESVYNSKCKLIATWQKGGNGIMTVNKIIPDTVNKNELKIFIPDSTRATAIKNKIATISLCNNKGRLVYFLTKTLYSTRSFDVIKDWYYDEYGYLMKTDSYKRWFYKKYEKEIAFPIITITPL